MIKSYWEDPPIPESLGGLKLYRKEVFEFFTNLRQLGIRAHPWP